MKFRSIFKIIKSKNRSVSFEGNNYAPIITGDVNAPISIDSQSFLTQNISKQAELFTKDVAGDQLPYLWAVRNCLNVLKKDTTLQKVDVNASQTNETVIMILNEQNKTTEGDIYKLKLFYHKKEKCKNIDWSKTISDVLLNIIKYSNHKGIDISKVSTTVTFNFNLEPETQTYLSNAKNGLFKRKWFFSNIDKTTSISTKVLQNIIPHIKFYNVETEYKKNNYTLNNSYFHDCDGSSNETLQALAASFYELSKSDSDFIVDIHEIEVRFGVTNLRELFPAPPIFDSFPSHAERSNHKPLFRSILKDPGNFIIHAEGGVGKTVTARLFCQQMPNGSHGVVYDCFGSGQYRTISRPRHTADTVLVQIINELAVEGLCSTLLANHQHSEQILKKFTSCIEQAVTSLKVHDDTAQLIIFIDAADNAEMAAKQHANYSIVKRLLNDFYIKDCKIVALCRTERVQLLEPRDEIIQFELSPFSETESYKHLLQCFPESIKSDGKEFHRLSGGNPRVQANAIDACNDSLSTLLINLGPTLATVDNQIEEQLDLVITNLKAQHIQSEGVQIELICTGLASLPPFIPINVLASIAGLPESAIRSFVNDLGRPLLVFDNAVQFRDEPTETWFRKRFLTSQSQALTFLDILKPLASQSTYVSESLPHLMLAAERFDDLIKLALSEDYLPLNNPIDARSIRVSRLQYALRAALSKEQYADALKLSLRSGEELASDKRQLDLLHENVGLIGKILSSSELQKMAFQSKLSGAWQGSNNLYTASLLSSADEYKGEARSYFRAASKWLTQYFKNQKQKDDHNQNDKLDDRDIVEFFYTTHNLFGIEETYSFIKTWTPKESMHSTISLFADRLLDNCEFSTLNSLVDLSIHDPYVSLHFIRVLHATNREISKISLNKCLETLLTPDKSLIKINESIPNRNFFSFIEACLAVNIDTIRLTKVFNQFIKVEAKSWFGVITGHDNERTTFLRAAALKSILSGKPTNIDSLLPSEFIVKNKSYDIQKDETKFRQVIGALLPYYILKTKIKAGHTFDIQNEINESNKLSSAASVERYMSRDDLPNEVAALKMSCLLYAVDVTHDQQIKNIGSLLNQKSRLQQNNALNLLYLAYRFPKTPSIAENIETYCYQRIKNYKDVYPEAIANDYLFLAKCVLPFSIEQSSKYFDDAVTSVSKFGDEALSRFMAVLALAKESSKAQENTPELVYRFARCTEIFGNDIREKHFPRAKALKTIHSMHPPSSFSVLARWLDREVIYLGRVQPALLEEAVKSGSLSSAEAWSSTGFLDWYGYLDFVDVCLEHEKNNTIKSLIFKDAIKQSRLRDFKLKSLNLLKKIGLKHDMSDKEFDMTIEELTKFSSIKTESKQSLEEKSHINSNRSEPNWNEIFDNKPCATSTDIINALKRFDEVDGYINRTSFWDALYSKFDSINGLKLFDLIIECDFDNEYELELALERVPSPWMSRSLIRDKWLNAFEIFCTRYALRVSNPWWLDHFTSKFPIKEGLEEHLRIGAVKGFKNESDYFDSESLFSMITVLSQCISSEEAQHCLDYALTRFELHIEDVDVDGDWASWLIPPESTCDSYAGFLWSALGNPRSEIRWQATHCIHKLVTLNCQDVINSILSLYYKVDSGCFGSSHFPFYSFHAQLYLLIGIYRGAQDTTKTLVTHKELFFNIATNSIHSFIEDLAKQISLKICNDYPNEFKKEEIDKLLLIGKSPFSKVIKPIDNKSFNTSFHERKEVDTSLKLRFFLDYQEYWLSPLARVFNISSKQLHQLVSHIVIKEWGISPDDNFIVEPRQELWHHTQRDTYSRHSNIPDTEPYDFYLAYHAIFVCASRLLREMPVVENSYTYEENEWQEWFDRGYLSRHDGYWLSDRRDPYPINRRAWILDEKSSNWRWEIIKTDFLEGLLLNKNGDTYICVSGYWKDHDGKGNGESFHIRSALASTENSTSLLFALATCSNPYDFKLPDYEENTFEINETNFCLKGWIAETCDDKRLDGSDPHTGDISYPGLELNPEVISMLNLNHDREKREYKNSDNKLAAFCELWSEPTDDNRHTEKLVKYGSRLYVSLKELLILCKFEECCIIFDVQISRETNNRNYKRDETDEIKYPRDYFNLYCLTSDGKLRDPTENYQLR